MMDEYIRGMDTIMQQKHLMTVLVLLMGFMLTSCSSNKVKEQANSKRTTQDKVVTQKNTKTLKLSKAGSQVKRKEWRARHRANINKRHNAQKRRSFRRITPGFQASFAKALSNAAMERTRHRVRYDGRYVKISYPWGDVPQNIGVCTDVVIRSYRRLGIDLQKAVHEDMSKGGFYDYPNVKKWNLSEPDKNIDHRRVYNLQAFFRRHGAAVPVTRNPHNYKPGDLVTWMVGPGLPHIGIVVEQKSKADPRRPMIVHNIAQGPKMEDILFAYPITGHYRYNKSNRLIAGRRFTNNYAATKSVNNDLDRLMREISRDNTSQQKRNIKRSARISQSEPVDKGLLHVAQLKADTGISDADIKTLLGD